jgi:predicted nucleic acid-binding protein
MAFLLDTNVVSELRKGQRCLRSVRDWYDAVPFEELFLSVLVFGELRRGIENLRRRDVVTATVLERWSHGLRLAHTERIIPVTWEICDIWGRLSLLHPMPTTDGLLAATARCYDLTVATRNTKDFQRCGVDYFNPFAD